MRRRITILTAAKACVHWWCDWESRGVCGWRRSFILSRFVALLFFGVAAKLGVIYFSSLPLVAGALFYEHRTARKLDLAGINRAFFQSNAFVSAVFICAVCADLWFRV